MHITFDPIHTSLMLRTMQSSLSITRHAIQFIWHTVLQNNNTHAFGILGSEVIGSIHHAIDANMDHGDELNHIAQTWQHANINICGIFQCSKPTLESIKTTQQALSTSFKLPHDSPFLIVQIILDTKGCLEAEVWLYRDNHLECMPFIMTEDGQLKVNG